MIMELAITKEAWDKLSISQKKKFSKQHPRSMFSRAFNLAVLKNKAKEIRNNIKQLKLDSSKRISKSKKDALLKSIKYNTNKLNNIKEEIKKLELLLIPKPSSSGSTSVNSKNPSVIKPIEKIVDYDSLPLPQEKDYKNKRWLEAEKFADEYIKLRKEDDRLRDLQYNTPSDSEDYIRVREERNKVLDKLYDMDKNKKKHLKYLRYNRYISSDSTVKSVRKDFYTYLDKVLEGTDKPSDFNTTYRLVQEAINLFGMDYFIALINTNEDYDKYWEILKSKPELSFKITPILTLFDDEQVKVHKEFETEEEQNKFLDSVCNVHILKNFNRKQELCTYLNDLSKRFIPFFIPKIKTSKHYKSRFADISDETLRLSVLSSDYLAYDNDSRVSRINKDIEEIEKQIQSSLSVGHYNMANRLRRQLKKVIKEGRFCCYTYGKNGESKFKFTVSHEYGHYLHSLALALDITIQHYIDNAYRQAITTGDIYKIGEYAKSNNKEFFAECFNRYANDGELPEYCSVMVREAINIAKSKIQNVDQIKGLFGW